MPLKIIERKSMESVSEYVYRTLKYNIIDMHLSPGQNISEKEMAEVLHVSRTPVREAFIKLSQEELLDIYPQKGTYISLIDLNHVEESRFMRFTLERAVINLACEIEFPAEILFEMQLNLNTQELCVGENIQNKLFELDEEFHRLIFAGCNKKRIRMMIEQMSAHFNRVRILNLASQEYWKLVVAEHRQIFEAIKYKKPIQAKRVTEEHLTRVIYDQAELKIKYPDYFK